MGPKELSEFFNVTPTPRSAFAVAHKAKKGKANSSASFSGSPKGHPSSDPRDRPQEPEPIHAPPYEQLARSPLNEFETDVEDQTLPAPPVLLSTWQRSSNNIHDAGDCIVLSLQLKETITILGQYGLQVMYGTVEIYGAILQSGQISHVVSVPTTHALPSITCTSIAASICLRTCSLQVRELRTLSPLFHHIWNHGGFKLDPTETGTPPDSFCFLRISTDDPLKRTIAPLWGNDELFATINKLCLRKNGRVPTILICGAKSTGKSTLGRLVINRLCTERASPSLPFVSYQTTFLLDLDPGQPEFAPPGHVSLIQIQRPVLGPAFTHSNTSMTSAFRPIRAHALSGLSPKVDPIHFLEAADQLMCEYRCSLDQNPGIPLVINCPGWAIGSGLEILAQFIQKWSPSDVVYLEHQRDKKIHSLLEQATGNNFLHIIDMPRFQPTVRTSSELRAMQAMSYFHSSDVDANGSMKWNPTPLSSMRPWVVRYDEKAPGIRAIMLYGETIPPECLATILEGCLVSIVLLEDEAVFSNFRAPRNRSTSIDDGMDVDMQIEGQLNDSLSSSSQSLPPSQEPSWPQVTRTPNENLPYLLTNNDGYTTPLDPRQSFTVGQAIVRAIDVESQTLHLITPVSEITIEGLQNGGHLNIVLVRGRWDTPDWLYTEDLTLAAYERSRLAKSHIATDRVGGAPNRAAGVGGGMGPHAETTYDDHDLKIPYVHFEGPANGSSKVLKPKKKKKKLAK